MEKCRYGKEHSLIGISSSYDYMNGCSVSVDWCEICGRVIKTERVLKDENWEEKNRTEKTPQIIREMFAAEGTAVLYQRGEGFLMAK